MALRRSRSRRDEEKRTQGFADRIAAATKPEPSGSNQGEAPTVVSPGLTRYQRRSANLPPGAKTLTAEEMTNIVIDLTDEDEAAAESDDD